ncbi:hypothetical protein GCM10007421_12010 [Halopseudomonas oceani]|jgi:hypothetical protein|uniref:DUF4190 domain-containing protein n=1 Tax=Halopseudomonas oceani TaxID=1708783 RepID=A0A2P4EWX2_9GAMM|nr:DUF4190 domain-containing protein [Halopseudomonas oceani]POB04511.1 hypothetical protein C1949_05935 [Halopseudomonas oceani]GGE39658.1 hypothetical protein GCM10007421_12010 [Halopseudomonas oceani]
MKGTVLDFNSISGGGVISCEAGNRYTFTRPQWKSATAPVAGASVDFVPVGNEATDVYGVASVTPQATPQAAQQPQVATTSSLAIISLVSGIVGLFIFGSLIAIVCGHIARSQIKNSGGTQSGDGMALTGLILGYIGIALWLLWFVAVGMIAATS